MRKAIIGVLNKKGAMQMRIISTMGINLRTITRSWL